MPSKPATRPSSARWRWRGCGAIRWSPRRWVGATRLSHIDDAVASLEIALSDDEVSALETPCTPRHDLQGISDAAVLARLSAKFGIKPARS